MVSVPFGRPGGPLAPGFAYLEGRITGTCDAQYSCTAMYEICRLARAFDPNFASVHLTPAFVDAMHAQHL